MSTTKMPPTLPPSLRRVLLLLIDHHLGNTVITLPVARELADYFQSDVDVLVDERYLDLATLALPKARLIPYPAQSRKRRGLRRNLAPLRLMAGLLQRRYDAVIDLTSGIRAATLTLCNLASRRVGFADAPRSWSYTMRIPAPDLPHAFDRYCAMLGIIGKPSGYRPPFTSLQPPQEAIESAMQAVDLVIPPRDARPAPLFVCHPSAGAPMRCWPPERFAQVGDWLLQQYGGRLVIIGTPGEAALGETVLSAMQSREQAGFLSLPLMQLLGLFASASLLFSNESGPTHLAAATTLPIITIFGPTHEEIWRPIREERLTTIRGASCDPGCGKRHCVAGNRCMNELTVDMMIAAIQPLLPADLEPISHP